MSNIIIIQGKEVNMDDISSVNFKDTLRPKRCADLIIINLNKTSQLHFYAESPEGIQELIDAKYHILDYLENNPL
jgi:hypothetical protein